MFTTAANHQYNMRFAANYVTGSHAFKVGMQDMWGTRNYRYDTNQSQAWTFLRGIPTTITEYARPLIDTEHLKSALGIYAQDRWTVNRLTLNLGLRFDYHNAEVPVQDLAAIPFVAGASLRRHHERAELEGPLAARRRHLRSLRRRQDRRARRPTTSTSPANRPTWRR